MIITSTSNPTIKTIRKLRDRKERTAQGLFFAEGPRIVMEAFEMKADVVQLVVAPDLLGSPAERQFYRRVIEENLPLLEVTPEVFQSISCKEGPKGLAAVIRQKWAMLAEVPVHQPGIWVGLDRVQDPGNLGTILRTMDSVGAKGVFLLDQSTDPYDPTAVRASMGAIFTLMLVKASAQEFCTWKKRTGIRVVGATGDVTTDYRAVEYPSPVVLLMGSEREGLLPAYRESCDELVSIPMVGRCDSLNLGIATGVMLYEIFHQHKMTGKCA